jgi:hypothetical protein
VSTPSGWNFRGLRFKKSCSLKVKFMFYIEFCILRNFHTRLATTKQKKVVNKNHNKSHNFPRYYQHKLAPSSAQSPNSVHWSPKLKTSTVSTSSQLAPRASSIGCSIVAKTLLVIQFAMWVSCSLSQGLCCPLYTRYHPRNRRKCSAVFHGVLYKGKKCTSAQQKH